MGQCWHWRALKQCADDVYWRQTSVCDRLYDWYTGPNYGVNGCILNDTKSSGCRLYALEVTLSTCRSKKQFSALPGNLRAVLGWSSDHERTASSE